MESAGQPIPVFEFQTIDSTNLEARRWVKGGGSGPRAFVARRQTAGMGQRGREWHSPDGGLWFTLAWPVDERRSSRVLCGLGERLGEACRDEIARFVENGTVEIRLPNDVLIDGHKVCGTLTETFVQAGIMWVIVGVGVNLANDPALLPDGLRTPPTAINRHRSKPMAPEHLLSAMISALCDAIESRQDVNDRIDWREMTPSPPPSA